jgi:hypothetical protein
MVGYNLTTIAESQGILELLTNTSHILLQDMLGILFLLVIFFVSLIAFYVSTSQTGKSLGGASFITFVFSILLVAVELAPPITIFITLIATAASLAFNWKE